MKRRFFRRVFILYVLLLFASVVAVNAYLSSVIRENSIGSLKRGLSIQVSILADMFHLPADRVLTSICQTMKEKTGARVTVIDAAGTVTCDSDRDSSGMDNHLNRPEIEQARGSGAGHSIRYSNTAQYEMLYTAHQFQAPDGFAGFVRLAVPLTEVNESITRLKIRINLAVVLAFLAFGLILIRQTERIRKFVTTISDHAGALAHGLFKKRLYLDGSGEFTELAHNLNQMAAELEEGLRSRDEETNRLNVILKSIPDALLLIDVQGVIELSNNAARELFGNAVLEGRPYIEVVRSPGFISLLDDVKTSRASGCTEIMIHFPDEKHLFVRVSPLFYEVGKLAGFVAIFHDSTQMKKLEQMRKDFVANVSHEIKTPVTAIKGFAETLLDGALHDRENAEKFLNTIRAHSERLNRLVEDLLIISRIELGVIKLHKTTVDLALLFDSIIQTTGIQAAKKDLTIKKSLEEQCSIYADRDRLEQILLNLVDNAIKFTDRGHIELGLSTEHGKKYIYVKDSGAGVPAKYIPRLGERFFRVDPSRSRELGGTGLGLAIVKHLVRALGWDMKIESKTGTGTIVKIYITS